MNNTIAPIEQLSQVLNNLKGSTSYIETPERGWIYKIRTTCNMPLKYLAKKLGVTVEAIKAYEKSEALDTEKKRKISIATLEKVADAMDMKLVYFMVPKEELTLLETLDKRLVAFEEERKNDIKHESEFQITKPPSLYYKEIPKKLWNERKRIFTKVDLSSLVKPPNQNNPG